jgi:hypothetical protein
MKSTLNNAQHLKHFQLCNLILVSRAGRLTWHGDVIPKDEIWIKIGGDKGGGSFKMNFQIVNTLTPNAVYNTCVFSCFEAGDSVTNLHVSLDRYKDDIKDLQGMMWKYVFYYLLRGQLNF